MRTDQRPDIALWRPWEHTFTSARRYNNPVQEVRVEVALVAPSGARHRVDGFWDGGTTWRVRFAPDETGEWSYSTASSDEANAGLHGRMGVFICGEPDHQTRFGLHGPVRVAPDRRYLEHADGTPFFWLADTAWNGPLRATAEEWEHYLDVRVKQQFTAVQWVATQWIAAPDGDRHNQLAYEGLERIRINPAFFQRLDARVDALNRAGLLAAPVLLWAASWVRPSEANNANPGYALPEDQAIILARYMVARWGASHVVWILPGDGDYRGAAAPRWRTIGRGVFGGRAHAPVALHPGGLVWVHDEFADEAWLDITGYQSGHSVDEESLRWLAEGPPATDWTREPIRPFINLEPPYEDHVRMSGDGRQRIDAHDVRRALYSSLLIAPVAGVSYGGHGVWGWDDGTQPPVAHPKTGIPRPWQEALHLPAAEQIRFLAGIFGDIPWQRLRPAQQVVVAGHDHRPPSRAIVAAQGDAGDLLVIYTPEGGPVTLCLEGICADLRAEWIDPQTGIRSEATFAGTRRQATFETPTPDDWVLVLKQGVL